MNKMSTMSKNSKTIIKNSGSMKTTIGNDHNYNDIHEMNWKADYNGKKANISLNMKDNNKFKHYEATLDNKDLEDLLSIPSINTPLDKRLTTDFLKRKLRKTQKTPKMIEIYQMPLTGDDYGSSRDIFTPISEEMIIPIQVVHTRRKRHGRNYNKHKSRRNHRRNHTKMYKYY
jgi:hypothetical protein